MEDILEEIVGEIWDEHDEIIEQITQVDEYTYKVKGTADLEELFEVLDIEDEMDFSTVNGWVLEVLGKIPQIGESFIFKNLKVVVTSADTKKVLEVNIHIVNLEPELTEDVE
jgi:CBS domain containing-hemolysin-like protein